MSHATPGSDEIDENTEITFSTDLEFSVLGTCVNALNMIGVTEQARVAAYLTDRYGSK